MMAFQQPMVLELVSLDRFISYILDNHFSLSTLVVCGTKERFVSKLANDSSAEPSLGQAYQNSPPAPHNQGKQRPWTAAPTLRLLSLSCTVRVVFCPDITHLRAYLATSASPEVDSNTSRGRLLAILNLASLHRPTSAFSAQGLNRTFAGAVEAAYRTGSRLVIAECYDVSRPEGDDATSDPANDAAVERPESSSVWNEDVSILNVTTKSFGAGERGWVGRTVKVRSVAARWCVFEKLTDG